MKRVGVFFLLGFALFGVPNQATAECVEPEDLLRSVAMLVYREEDVGGVMRIRASGTAWFYSSTILITNAHVALEVRTGTDHPRPLGLLRLRAGERSLGDIESRIVEYDARAISITRVSADAATDDPSSLDDVAVIRLATPIPDVRPLRVSARKPIDLEDVASIAFTSSYRKLVIATGRVLKNETKWGVALLLQAVALPTYEPFVFARGASGAPIVNCAGEVIAMLASVPWPVSPKARALWRERFAGSAGIPNGFGVSAESIRRHLERASVAN
jgi:hypothetical protein